MREVQYGLQHTEIVPRHDIDIGIFGQLACRHALSQKVCQNLTLILLKPAVSGPAAATLSALRLRLRRAFDAAFQPMDLVNDPNACFIPDSMPQPLAIQIAGNINGSKVDDFAKHFNGIGVVVQRVGGTAQDPWAHANLADLG